MIINLINNISESQSDKNPDLFSEMMKKDVIT